MFGRFFTRCPIDDPREKAWTELRMQWLSERFGLDVMRDCRVLLPTPEFFPEPYEGKPEDVEPMLQVLCRQFDVDPDEVELTIGHPETDRPAAGSYQQVDGKAVIHIDPGQLPHQEYVAAVLAHELAHHRLRGDGRVNGDEEDHEELTDLLPVYFGAGIFAANATVQDASSSDGLMHYWSINRQGYLPSRLFGYALALFSWVRDEEKPVWVKHLRKDAREVFLSATHYLKKTGDSHFGPVTAGRKLQPLTVADLISELQTGSPSRQTGVLWMLQERGDDAAEAVPAVLRTIHNRTPMIAATALDTLAAIGRPDAEVESEIRPLLHHAHPTVRSLAIRALLELSPRREETVQDFVASFNDSKQTVICWAAYALGECGPSAAMAESALLTVLKRAIIKHHGLLAVLCLHALRAIDIDADQLRNAFLDPEIHGQAIDYLRDLQELDDPPLPPDPFNLSNRSGMA